MRLYFEKILQKGLASNVNFYLALEAFTDMGFHIIEVEDVADIPTDDHESVVVGSINFMHKMLCQLGRDFPTDLDYPPSLESFMGRKVWASTIGQIDNDVTKWNVFIKPRGLSKKFTGRVVKNIADFRGTADQQYDVPIWISEIVEFEREWRVFVRYEKILDIRPYKGDWRKHYNVECIEQAVKAFRDAPNGYAMDFGVTKEGRTLLVEVNDGYSVGAYGLFYINYAKFLSARWAQLTGTIDLCAFDL